HLLLFLVSGPLILTPPRRFAPTLPTRRRVPGHAARPTRGYAARRLLAANSEKEKRGANSTPPPPSSCAARSRAAPAPASRTPRYSCASLSPPPRAGRRRRPLRR